MDIDQANPGELAASRAGFAVDDGGESALGRQTVDAFEAEHGVVLPQPSAPNRGHSWLVIDAA
jgi:hypothetical protein